MVEQGKKYKVKPDITRDGLEIHAGKVGIHDGITSNQIPTNNPNVRSGTKYKLTFENGEGFAYFFEDELEQVKGGRRRRRKTLKNGKKRRYTRRH